MVYRFDNIGKARKDLFYDGDIHPEKVFLALFNGLPNIKPHKGKLDAKKVIEEVKKKYEIRDNENRIIRFTNSVNASYVLTSKITKKEIKYLVIIDENILFYLEYNGYAIYYNSDVNHQKIETLQNFIKPFVKKKDKERKSHFYMITREYGNFHLKKYKVKGFDVDIKSHYNDDFVTFDNSVKSFLKDKNKTGLILMHGESGTGKTTYIRHLIKTINRKFIFLPLFMANSLTDPDLVPFLSKHKNSIVIIEDSEKLIKSRKSGEPDASISTLLNISDGLLSDAFGIKLICTFNTGLEKIDKALLRKGRLINRYEFKKLSVKKAMELAKKELLRKINIYMRGLIKRNKQEEYKKWEQYLNKLSLEHP